ncbi:M24 family metallopeptidase [Nostocoides japonicum]|nr:Xaa-Pro peptidase family protein [Tetrasphaera japonica]
MFFDANEYAGRLEHTRALMLEREVDSLVVADPANICYLTGFDACSFYAPQILIVPRQDPMMFFCRSVDAPSAWQTTILNEDQVFAYSEQLVQQIHTHPADWIAEQLRPRLEGSDILAVEPNSPYYTLRTHQAFVDAFGASIVSPAGPGIVNLARCVKSPAELDAMRTAGKITGQVFEVAAEVIKPGTRQCDAVGEIYAAQMRGAGASGGTYTAIPPLVLAGSNTAYPHVPWSDQPFEDHQAIAVELSGCYARYHAPVARTIFLGDQPKQLRRIAGIVDQGLDAALSTIHQGAACSDVAASWQEVISRHGLEKKSRIGYPVGIGFPPDWGEQTISLRAEDHTVLRAGMTIHVMIGMWLDGWGYSVSETIAVTSSGVELLSNVPRLDPDLRN